MYDYIVRVRTANCKIQNVVGKYVLSWNLSEHSEHKCYMVMIASLAASETADPLQARRRHHQGIIYILVAAYTYIYLRHL